MISMGVLLSLRAITQQPSKCFLPHSIFPELQEPTYYDIHIIEEDIPDSIIFQKKTPES